MKNLLFLGFILLISACSSTGSKPVDKIYYRFPAVTQTAIDKNISIERPTAMGILGNRPMVAQNTNGGLVQMNHSFWIDSPKILLYNYLNKVFTHKNNDANKLYTQILNIEKKAESSILSIKFVVVDKDKEEIFSKTYHRETTLSENNIPSFVKSISMSLNEIVQQFNGDFE